MSRDIEATQAATAGKRKQAVEEADLWQLALDETLFHENLFAAGGRKTNRETPGAARFAPLK